MITENNKIVNDILYINNKNSSEIKISHKLLENLFFDSEYKLDIYSIRIILYIVNKLRSNQFNIKNGQTKQSKLFEDNFLYDNLFTNFTIDISELNINKNTIALKKSILFLTEYKKAVYQMKYDNQSYKAYGGLITAPIWTKNKVSFLISNYWLENILNINPYNEFLYDLLKSIKDNTQFIFILWLSKLDNHTTINRLTLNDRLKINLSIKKYYEFLKKQRLFLDTNNTFSFNYTIYPKEDKISFTKYLTSGNQLKQDIFTSNEDYLNIQQKQKIKYKIKYLKNKYNIKNTDILKGSLEFDYDLIIISYKNFVKENRKNLSYFQNELFLYKLQKYVDLEFGKTGAFRRGYKSPRVI